MKKANQSQEDTDIEKRNYDSPLERPPRLDLRNDSAPVRDSDEQSEKIQKRQDLGGTSVYQKETKSAASSEKKKKAQDSGEPIRYMHGFKPSKENLSKLVEIESKLDICLKFLSEAMAEFCSLKSVDISPDGKLGGRGFSLEIPEIRARLYSSVDNISHIVDTLYDETRGEHWQKEFQTKQQEQVPQQEIVEESQAKISSVLEKVLKKANVNKR